jgi:hypothetical protein
MKNKKIKNVDAQAQRNLPKLSSSVQLKNDYMKFGPQLIPVLYNVLC